MGQEANSAAVGWVVTQPTGSRGIKLGQDPAYGITDLVSGCQAAGKQHQLAPGLPALIGIGVNSSFRGTSGSELGGGIVGRNWCQFTFPRHFWHHASLIYGLGPRENRISTWKRLLFRRSARPGVVGGDGGMTLRGGWSDGMLRGSTGGESGQCGEVVGAEDRGGQAAVAAELAAAWADGGGDRLGHRGRGGDRRPVRRLRGLVWRAGATVAPIRPRGVCEAASLSATILALDAVAPVDFEVNSSTR